jgi:hypothetical protein
MPKPESPAAAGKRICGICSKPLSQYNRDDICMSHKPEDIARYRSRVERQAKESRAIASFVREFHGESTAAEMFQTALKKSKGAQTPRKVPVTELERYTEAVGLLKSASRVFRISMFSILRLTSVNPKYKVVRSVLMYLMKKELQMEIEDIGIFLGYNYTPNIRVAIEKVTYDLLEDEDIILAVDLVREEYKRVEAEEIAA